METVSAFSWALMIRRRHLWDAAIAGAALGDVAAAAAHEKSSNHKVPRTVCRFAEFDHGCGDVVGDFDIPGSLNTMPELIWCR